MIHTVVFDVGNVLLGWDPRLLYRKLLPDEAAVEGFLETVCTPAWNAEQDRGRSWADAVAELVTTTYPQHEALIRAYDERWHETVSGPIDGSVALLRELADAGVPLYALTNFSEAKFNETRERHDFFELFDGIVVSGTERLIKPDPSIFHVLIERYRLQPKAVLFIDDSAANVQTASALGLSTITFTNPSALRRDLLDYGLPVAPA